MAWERVNVYVIACRSCARMWWHRQTSVVRESEMDEGSGINHGRIGDKSLQNLESMGEC